jgi:hypothetical protein
MGVVESDTRREEKVRGRRSQRQRPTGLHRRDQEVLVWADLCEVARRTGMAIREEILPEEARVSGGVVRRGADKIFIVDARLPLGMKVRALMDALRTVDLEGVYMPPYLRDRFAPVP